MHQPKTNRKTPKGTGRRRREGRIKDSKQKTTLRRLRAGLVEEVIHLQLDFLPRVQTLALIPVGGGSKPDQLFENYVKPYERGACDSFNSGYNGGSVAIG